MSGFLINKSTMKILMNKYQNKFLLYFYYVQLLCMYAFLVYTKYDQKEDVHHVAVNNFYVHFHDR